MKILSIFIFSVICSSVFAQPEVKNNIIFYLQNDCPATIHFAISNYNTNDSFSFFNSRIFPSSTNVLVGKTRHPTLGITSFYGHVGMAPNPNNTFLVFCPGNWTTCQIMNGGILVDGESYLITIIPPTFFPESYDTVDILINQL